MIRFANLLRGEGLRARTIRGTLMTGINFGGQNALRLIGNLLLTRILFPEAFGLMALVQVVMTGLAMFSDLGIRASIVQDERGGDPAFLNTAWTIQIGRGVVLFLAVWVLASPVAIFYDAPILEQMLPIAGLTALFQGFNSTKMATASRDIRLGRMAILGISVQGVGLLVMIVLSLWTGSVWALVIGGLVAPFLLAVFSHIVLPGHRNTLGFERSAARRLIGFGKYIFLATMAGFLISQADRAILGKTVTLEELALYNIGFFLASVPLLLMRKLTENILFPLYANRPPRENFKNRSDVARTRFFIISGMLALSAVLAMFGNTLVIALYDPRYEAAGALLVLIALAQLPMIVTGNYGAVLLAAGHSGRFAAQIMLSAGLRTTLMLIGAYWYGMVGVVIAPAIAAIVYYPVMVWFIRPYGGWMPRQDAGFSVLGLGILALAIWINADVLVDMWSQFAP